MLGAKLNWLERLFEEYLVNHIPDNDLALKFLIWEGELNRAWDSAANTFYLAAV